MQNELSKSLTFALHLLYVLGLRRAFFCARTRHLLANALLMRV
nr:MAG TPA: hypothetical protein [Caudoviricetes sp.]